MTTDQFFWLLARVTGLSSYATLAIALVTGIALRTAVLDWLAGNRALRSLHEFTTMLWIPLAALHVLALLLDTTARLGVLDVVVPFHSSYGTLAIGLGALSLDLLVAVTVTALLKRRIRKDVWLWIHRLAYGAYALIFLQCGAEWDRLQRPSRFRDHVGFGGGVVDTVSGPVAGRPPAGLTRPLCGPTLLPCGSHPQTCTPAGE